MSLTLSADELVVEDAGAIEEPRCWIFLSSGARALYLENVVRSLAMPEGETIQYRYEEGLVAPTFIDLIDQTKAPDKQAMVGETAYLSYLDNRDSTKTPVVYPVREAQIVEAARRGSTLIVKLKLLNFLKWGSEQDLRTEAQGKSQDALPTWITDGQDEHGKEKVKRSGYWVACSKPFAENCLSPYSADDGKHLLAFENAVDAIMTGADFKDGKTMFANILQFRDLTKNKPVQNGKIVAGRAYELAIYHYQGADGTHKDFGNFWLEITSENEDIIFISQTPKPIEARYDEVKFSFRVKEDAWASKANLNIAIFRKDRSEKGVEAIHYGLRSKITLKLVSNFWRRFLFGLAMGSGLFMTQYIALSVNTNATNLTYFGSFIFSILVGMGASFQFRTKP